jgi:hypothetical protein
LGGGAEGEEQPARRARARAKVLKVSISFDYNIFAARLSISDKPPRPGYIHRYD